MTTVTLEALRSVLMDIKSGALDEELILLTEAIKDRKLRLRPTFFPDDTVHFSEKTRPRYLIGLPAIVVRVNPQSVTLRCPDEPQYQKWAGCPNMRCPNDLIAELAV